MKASLLLALVCTAVLAAGARADTPREPETLVRKVQVYAQKATAMAKSALSMVQESEAAQLTRRWLAENADLAKQRMVWLKEKVEEIWKQAPAM
ncbi:APOC3 protein, partial [Nycticryphes semicollaris]|nr:APOC3 protein [Nycticryphes semicollaris]